MYVTLTLTLLLDRITIDFEATQKRHSSLEQFEYSEAEAGWDFVRRNQTHERPVNP